MEENVHSLKKEHFQKTIHGRNGIIETKRDSVTTFLTNKTKIIPRESGAEINTTLHPVRSNRKSIHINAGDYVKQITHNLHRLIGVRNYY